MLHLLSAWTWGNFMVIRTLPCPKRLTLHPYLPHGEHIGHGTIMSGGGGARGSCCVCHHTHARDARYLYDGNSLPT